MAARPSIIGTGALSLVEPAEPDQGWVTRLQSPGVQRSRQKTRINPGSGPKDVGEGMKKSPEPYPHSNIPPRVRLDLKVLGRARDLEPKVAAAAGEPREGRSCS